MDYMYSLGTEISKGVTVLSLIDGAFCVCCRNSMFRHILHTNICPGRKGNTVPEYMLDTILCTAHESRMILETSAAAAVTETERVPVLRQVSVAQRSFCAPLLIVCCKGERTLTAKSVSHTCRAFS